MTRHLHINLAPRPLSIGPLSCGPEENTKGRVKTQLLTSKPHMFKSMKLRVKFPTGEYQEGRLHKVSDDPAELIPQSDIVIWTGPVTTTKAQQLCVCVRQSNGMLRHSTDRYHALAP